MAIYCFECGVEVSDSQKILRNGRVFCSLAHARTRRKEAAPPQVKPAAPAPAAPSTPTLAPAAKPATAGQASGAPAAVTTKPPQS
jgi:hypothetical protein